MGVPASHYDHFISAIAAFEEDFLWAHMLYRPLVPSMHAPQIHLLMQYEDYPHAFCKKVWVNHNIFDHILDQIINHPIFHSQSLANPQLPIAVQLAVFLNHTGHYGNAISISDVALWAGVSEGSVVNCTNWAMTALLDQYNEFIKFPDPDSADCTNANTYAGSVSTCQQWCGGWLAAYGSSIPPFQKPGYYGETFYNRKSRYSLNCQVCVFYFIFSQIWNFILLCHCHAPQPANCELWTWSPG